MPERLFSADKWCFSYKYETYVSQIAFVGIYSLFICYLCNAGGRLKDYEHRDKESLQARWCTVEQIKSHKKGFPIRLLHMFACTKVFVYIYMFFVKLHIYALI